MEFDAPIQPPPLPQAAVAQRIWGPSVPRAIALCVLFQILMALFFFAAALARKLDSLHVLLVVSQVLIWPIVLKFGINWCGTSGAEAFPLGRVHWRLLPGILMLAVGMEILAVTLVNAMPMPESMARMLRLSSGASGGGWFWAVAAFVVAPAVGEELLFRGLILQGLVQRHGAKAAVWISAILFAAFHLNPWQAVIAIFIGLAGAWLFLRTKALLPCILLHMAVNVTAIFGLEPICNLMGYTDMELMMMSNLPPLVMLLGAVLTAAGLLVLRRELRKDDGGDVLRI